MQKYWKPEKLFWYIFYFEYFFPRKKIKYFTFSESLILMIFPGKYLQFDVVLSAFLVWAFFIKISELLIEEKIFVTLLRLAVMLRLYNINITVVILMWNFKWKSISRFRHPSWSKNNDLIFGWRMENFCRKRVYLKWHYLQKYWKPVNAIAICLILIYFTILIVLWYISFWVLFSMWKYKLFLFFPKL